MKVKSRWLLASDLHFKLHDLDRVARTADWIASIPHQYNVSRAIICGDLFTTRTSQPTNVLAACYRFLDKLGSAVPHMDIILGNHDLAYRRDYTTSALEALAIARLAPFVTLHTEIGFHKWDGRDVLVMPFREDQGEIIKHIRDLDPNIAEKTVGFAHLAINRAITQKHIINPETGMAGLPNRYPGLTSAGEFAPLARTFTGHFHSHQTIFQATNQNGQDPRGSITYIGAPLQLTWADLFDTRKGAILLDPETLDVEFLDNPHAVGYTCVEAQEVLAGRIDIDQIRDKHVMVTGKLSMYKYISARDRLVKLGARSVRDWKHVVSGFSQSGLGKTMLPADIQNRRNREEEVSEAVGNTLPNLTSPLTAASSELATGKVELKPIDLTGLIEEYVSSLDLESTLDDRRDILSLVGKRLFNLRNSSSDKVDYDVKYKDMLDPSPQSALFIPANDALQTSKAETIFVADPVSIEITNFLGVQGTLSLDFKQHFQPGINLIVGHNGAGKSTIIEAIVWCQFGQCIRGGLGVNDVVNDVAKKNCNVRLTFANGYTISRFRKHAEFRNGVIVEKDGVIQSQFEGPDAKSTQASIDSLLGVDFDTFIRIVLLGNESAPSFLNSNPLQKRQLIELVLGLEVLDGCAETCNSMLNQVEEELGGMQSQLGGVTHKAELLTSRVGQINQTLKLLQQEVASLAKEMEGKKLKHEAIMNQKELVGKKLRESLEAEKLLPDLKPKLLSLRSDISSAQNEVDRLDVLARLAQARSFIDRERVIIEQEVITTNTQLHHHQDDLQRLIEENSVLDIPSSSIDEHKDIKRDGNSGAQGFILNVTLAFRKFWTSILNIVSPRAREIALRAMEARRRWDEHTKAVITLTNRITHMQDRIASMMDNIASLPSNVASQTGINEGDVHLALRKLTAQEALKVPRQLTLAIDELRTLSNRHTQLQLEHETREKKRLRKQRDVEEHEKQTESIRKSWTESFNKYHLSLARKEQEITTHKELLESEVESLAKYSHQIVDLRKEVASIDSNREIFAFWQSALTRRQVSASRHTFRRHVIGRHLGELNKLLGQILMVMYQDAHYARHMTSGALKTLFEDDGETPSPPPSNNEEEGSTSVLEPSLSMASTLGYSKKSGGERKRVDLALFFALFVMSEARSAHRARYMLVDEAFDGLDAAGQAAVLKLCHWMTGRLAYVFVITHSRSFITLAEDEGGAEGEVGASVVMAKAGEKGTEFVVNGVCVSSAAGERED
ncbi:P-loop containing nucleoside triphosphate hydrolase protein [Annulohypoxylon maeteangense]|uniref:P-loop containing nucleoside triphosphate hydrolase protein n=1 Tax=Annulohypoxylon maeteangense TaxID=1927788 RepID=UPI002007D4CB|nr:P-loop containing nucleoside triphosphate hydrolase protein [Annulohypoxylon maeteangense]KAI0883751.1 P-loop containing nucleoside triphosphate hydrolase protein [Annulohypoxylon maeteangense]